jgi:branched-chain amino acid transport system ATP-binding protein
MRALLECRGVSKSFNGLAATTGIDLSVAAGEIIGIIGANGAGKTTLLNMISGYLRPSAGSIRFDGHDVTGLEPRILTRRGIARSFQVPQLFLEATVRENMMLALSLLVRPRSELLHRFSNEVLALEADRALEHYDIQRHAHVTVRTVPQGVRKLLDIGMATCGEPLLILLDEPTSGVSSEEKHSLMRRLMSRLRARSTTTIFIEHDMEIVKEYASRVVALFDGRVIADGEPDVVFRDNEVLRLIVGRTHSPADA